MGDGEREEREIQHWEFDNINLHGHADILICDKSSPAATFMIWGI